MTNELDNIIINSRSFVARLDVMETYHQSFTLGYYLLNNYLRNGEIDIKP